MRADLTPLIALKNTLYKLSLRKNDVADVSALTGFCALRDVDLSWNNITDASSLTDLVSPDGLSRLWLEYNPLERISDFAIPEPSPGGYYDFDMFIDFTGTAFSKRSFYCSFCD